MVSIRQSRKGQFSSVTVSFWYYEQMSSKICLELSGCPLQSLPLIQRRGVKQYSSQFMYIVYFLQSSSFSYPASSPLIYKKPSFPLLSVICCSVSLRMRKTEVAGAIKYCLSRGSNLLGFESAFCQFHPKLVSWSPACTNCSGDSMPFASKSFSEGVNLELKKFLMPSNMDVYIVRAQQYYEGMDDKKRPPWGLNPRPLSQEPNALPTELDGLLTTSPSLYHISSSLYHKSFIFPSIIQILLPWLQASPILSQ